MYFFPPKLAPLFPFSSLSLPFFNLKSSSFIKSSMLYTYILIGNQVN